MHSKKILASFLSASLTFFNVITPAHAQVDVKILFQGPTFEQHGNNGLREEIFPVKGDLLDVQRGYLYAVQWYSVSSAVFPDTRVRLNRMSVSSLSMANATVINIGQSGERPFPVSFLMDRALNRGYLLLLYRGNPFLSETDTAKVLTVDLATMSIMKMTDVDAGLQLLSLDDSSAFAYAFNRSGQNIKLMKLRVSDFASVQELPLSSSAISAIYEVSIDENVLYASFYEYVTGPTGWILKINLSNMTVDRTLSTGNSIPLTLYSDPSHGALWYVSGSGSPGTNVLRALNASDLTQYFETQVAGEKLTFDPYAETMHGTLSGTLNWYSTAFNSERQKIGTLTLPSSLSAGSLYALDTATHKAYLLSAQTIPSSGGAGDYYATFAALDVGAVNPVTVGFNGGQFGFPRKNVSGREVGTMGFIASVNSFSNAPSVQFANETGYPAIPDGVALTPTGIGGTLSGTVSSSKLMTISMTYNRSRELANFPNLDPNKLVIAHYDTANSTWVKAATTHVVKNGITTSYSDFRDWGTFQLCIDNSTSNTSNTAPVVSIAGPATALVGQKIQLTGTAIDDGLPAVPGGPTFQWQDAGATGHVVFDSLNTASTQVRFDSPGTYHLKLTVYDGDLYGVATLRVSVTASLSPDNRIPNHTVCNPQKGEVARISTNGSAATMDVFNRIGQKVASSSSPEGQSYITWNCKEVSAGTYAAVVTLNDRGVTYKTTSKSKIVVVK